MSVGAGRAETDGRPKETEPEAVRPVLVERKARTPPVEVFSPHAEGYGSARPSWSVSAGAVYPPERPFLSAVPGTPVVAWLTGAAPGGALGTTSPQPAQSPSPVSPSSSIAFPRTIRSTTSGGRCPIWASPTSFDFGQVESEWG